MYGRQANREPSLAHEGSSISWISDLRVHTPPSCIVHLPLCIHVSPCHTSDPLARHEVHLLTKEEMLYDRPPPMPNG